MGVAVAIIFERDPDSGALMVRDIFEGTPEEALEYAVDMEGEPDIAEVAVVMKEDIL